jgi:hypothetical protein
MADLDALLGIEEEPAPNDAKVRHTCFVASPNSHFTTCMHACCCMHSTAAACSAHACPVQPATQTYHPTQHIRVPWDVSGLAMLSSHAQMWCQWPGFRGVPHTLLVCEHAVRCSPAVVSSCCSTQRMPHIGRQSSCMRLRVVVGAVGSCAAGWRHQQRCSQH